MHNKEGKRPTGSDNPALTWFSHLLPEDGLYSAEDVMIYWHYEDSSKKVCDVAVIYLPRTHMKQKGYKDHPVTNMVSAVYSKDLFQASSGNCFLDWMKYDNQKSPPPHDPDTRANLGFGPNEDFECLKAWGFASPEEEHRAIREFAQIRECQWARYALHRDMTSIPFIEDML